MENNDWKQFQARCSGEWEGRQRLYDGSGNVIPVPDWIVPEEFLQWGLPFNDLLTQFSVKVEDGGINGKLFRQVPQVGCQSDMVHVHSKEPFQVYMPDLFGFPCGSYVRRVPSVLNSVNRTIAGPYKVPHDVGDELYGLELCLTQAMHSTEDTAFYTPGYRQRIRVICIYGRSVEKPLYVLYTLEKWASDHNDGQSLVACASAAAVADLPNSTTPLMPEQWQLLSTSGRETKKPSELNGLVNLPHNAQVRFCASGVLTVAWDAAGGERRTLTSTTAREGPLWATLFIVYDTFGGTLMAKAISCSPQEERQLSLAVCVSPEFNFIFFLESCVGVPVLHSIFDLMDDMFAILVDLGTHDCVTIPIPPCHTFWHGLALGNAGGIVL